MRIHSAAQPLAAQEGFGQDNKVIGPPALPPTTDKYSRAGQRRKYWRAVLSRL